MRSRRTRWTIATFLAALLLWAGLDLYGPLRVDIRSFDPNVIARLDTEMWRSYYDKKPVPMFFQLAELMRRQFHFPFLRSHVVAARAARAAFVFKRGHERSDYEKALPDLMSYYRSIESASGTPFDVPRTARLELEWWIVHRERTLHSEGDLGRALAETAAEMYLVPASSLMEYGRLRAGAMTVRDTTAASGRLDRAGWQGIQRTLEASWRALWNAVQATAARETGRGPRAA